MFSEDGGVGTMSSNVRRSRFKRGVFAGMAAARAFGVARFRAAAFARAFGRAADLADRFAGRRDAAFFTARFVFFPPRAFCRFAITPFLFPLP